MPRAFLVTNQGCSGKGSLHGRGGRGWILELVLQILETTFQNLEFETICSMRFWLFLMDSHCCKIVSLCFSFQEKQ